MPRAIRCWLCEGPLPIAWDHAERAVCRNCRPNIPPNAHLFGRPDSPEDGDRNPSTDTYFVRNADNEETGEQVVLQI